MQGLLLWITKIARMCGCHLAMDDIMLACGESAGFFFLVVVGGGGVTLLLAILTLQRKGSLVKSQPASSHLSRSHRLPARSEYLVPCPPPQTWGL